jgi:hypothetical protein
MNLLQAKLNLYRMLLLKQDQTDSEINIMFELSKDPDIQQYFESIVPNEYQNDPS